MGAVARRSGTSAAALLLSTGPLLLMRTAFLCLMSPGFCRRRPGRLLLLEASIANTLPQQQTGYGRHTSERFHRPRGLRERSALLHENFSTFEGRDLLRISLGLALGAGSLGLVATGFGGLIARAGFRLGSGFGLRALRGGLVTFLAFTSKSGCADSQDES